MTNYQIIYLTTSNEIQFKIKKRRNYEKNILGLNLLLSLTVMMILAGTAKSVTINGTLDSVPPPSGPGYTTATGMQDGRLNRNGAANASTCAAPQAFPGTFAAGTLRQYDAYTFTPTASSCVTITYNSTDANGNIQVAAYNQGGFNPNNLAANFLAHSGVSTGIPGSPVTFSFNVTAGVPFTIVVVDANATAPPLGYTFDIDVQLGTTAPANAPVDLNGDGKTDFTVVRNTGGGTGGAVTWFTLLNGGSPTQIQWGISTDSFVPEDFDGDGKDDVTVWRAGTQAYFYTFRSSNNTLMQNAFGQTGDDPTVVGDYDGDGKADYAVYRGGATAGAQSFWFYRASTGANSGQVIYTQFGQNGDFPAPGDYDGDGKRDFVVQRSAGNGTANFFMKMTASANATVNFGTPTDVIVPGDYDGDGKTDIATRRSANGVINWYIRPSSGGAMQTYQFGASATDFAVQGNYDGDNKTDIAVWRPSATAGQSAFYYRGSATGNTGAQPWGQSGDYPVANYNNH